MTVQVTVVRAPVAATEPACATCDVELSGLVAEDAQIAVREEAVGETAGAGRVGERPALREEKQTVITVEYP